MPIFIGRGAPIYDFARGSTISPPSAAASVYGIAARPPSDRKASISVTNFAQAGSSASSAWFSLSSATNLAFGIEAARRRPSSNGTSQFAALAPPQSADGPGPFALSASGAVEAALEAAGFHPIDRGRISIVLDYPNAEAASWAFMAGGGSARATQHSGQEHVRRAIGEALEGFRAATGDYRIENHFQFLIAD